MVKKITEKKMMENFIYTFSSSFLILLLTCFISMSGGTIALLLKHDRSITEIKIELKNIYDCLNHKNKNKN